MAAVPVTSASGAPPSRLKVVRYLGYRFRVPGAWPVIDNRRDRHGCVRFDQHAIYLGPVSGDEFCPSWLLGTTESMLVEPGPARAPSVSTENPVARQVTVRAPRVVITATFDTDPNSIYAILASARLPAPHIALPDPGGTASTAAGGPAAAGPRLDGTGHALTPTMHYPMAAPLLPATVASYSGLGFDACAAPSQRYMRAWRRWSPYRAVGVYIGGADRACAQPNLNRGWVRTQAAAGWRFIPLYAGPQAAFGEIHSPYRQGRLAGLDAVAQARRLGFGPRTPLYYDMEAFGRRSRLSVLKFLSAWTKTLHRLSFSSGVYSSSDSGIVDLARQYSSHRFAMPNVIFDALWNGSRSTADGNLRSRQWARHRRIHQFSGNVTQRFGGDTLNIDKDYLDVRVSAAYAAFVTAQATSAVSLPGGNVMVFYQARDHRLWMDRYVPGSGWARPRPTGAAAWSVPSAVWDGGAVAVFCKDAAGYLWLISYRKNGRQIARRRLSVMGVLGPGPFAVAQPGGVIDVFWRGSVDDHLWQGQFTPGSGWNGPQGLGGDLASPPSPVTSSPGFTAVFWKGTDASLWMISRGLLGKWSKPRRLGMPPLGGLPLATGQDNGGIEVYWPGSGNPYLWEGFYSASTGWRGPRDLGGQIRSTPWPVTQARQVLVLWRGPEHQMYYSVHTGRGWNVLAWTKPTTAHVGGWLGAAPFTAVGGTPSTVRVFWRGQHGSLWTASLTGAAWSRSVRLSLGRSTARWDWPSDASRSSGSSPPA